MIKLIAPKRTHDNFGYGSFGASRDGGSRKHNGQDYSAIPDSIVLSHTAGKVTKLGYPYKNDLSYRYVEITDGTGNRWRYFYVEPTVSLGRHLSAGVPIGTVQNLDKRYSGITNHVHLEVIATNGDYLDPELLK